MKTTPIVQHTLHNVGENLYRDESSGIYYALFKRDGKQIRRSLKTTDKDLARPKLGDPSDQFKALLAAMRTNKGKRDAEQSANLVEFLGYSGWRKGEAPNLRWEHVNFDLGHITIAGDAITGPKNRRAKTVPMSPPLIRLLTRLHDALPSSPKPEDRVFPINDPRKAMDTACKTLGYPKFTVHSLRHFFVTNCVEAGLDFCAIAGLVNHSDGGALLARRYAHLRDTHLAASVKKLTFDATAEEPENVLDLPTATANKT